MFAKQNQLILLISFFMTSLYVSAETPNRVSAERILSVEEYNESLNREKQSQYLQFQQRWQAFLKGSTPQQFQDVQPAWARKATEDFLIETGKLKAAFGLASKANNYGFTFNRPDDENSRKASFHRGHRSIFMDLRQMSANEWLMVFVHEVAHSLDSELFDSLNIYNNIPYLKDLEELGNKKILLSSLSVEERFQLDRWLMAGLNRGFLTEYRAWLLTLMIYEEGLQDRTFQPIPWLDHLKDSRPQNVSNQAHVLRHLSKSWTDPQDGIFSFTFIQQALAELRQKIDANPGLVKMGAIGALLEKSKTLPAF